MELLGVLLGVTVSSLIALVVVLKIVHDDITEDLGEALEAVDKLTERVVFLEKRKALLAESAASYQVPGVGVMAGKPAQKPRTWNQDAPAVGE